MSDQSVIIVGGGICGLMAARMLAAKYNVTIIEYRNELGGRIRSFPLAGAQGCIEAGAEFVHGDLPETLQLLKEAGLDHVKAEGKMLRKKGKEWIEEEEMVEGWDTLLEHMKNQDPDLTMQQLLDEKFPGDKYSDFRRQIRQFVQGFDVAEPEKVSVKSLYREWSAEEQNYRIPEGYSALIRFLENDCVEKGCSIVTGQAVRQIDWQKNDVTAYTASGEKFRAEKMVVTVPISVLRDVSGVCSINITPPVDDYVKASLEIGFGTVIKIIIDFAKPLWKPGTAFILSDEAIPTWWTQYPLENNLLTGWAGGPTADRLAHHSDEELLQIGINSLSRIFDLAQDELRNNVRQSFVFNWKKYGETLGAYSYATPDSTKARQLLNTPLEDSLFFAGEGLYDGKDSGTVEAALVSGKIVAERLLRS